MGTGPFPHDRIPKGQQWDDEGKVSDLGCCTGFLGECIKCCPPADDADAVALTDDEVADRERTARCASHTVVHYGCWPRVFHDAGLRGEQRRIFDYDPVHKLSAVYRQKIETLELRWVYDPWTPCILYLPPYAGASKAFLYTK